MENQNKTSVFTNKEDIIAYLDTDFMERMEQISQEYKNLIREFYTRIPEDLLDDLSAQIPRVKKVREFMAFLFDALIEKNPDSILKTYEKAKLLW